MLKDRTITKLTMDIPRSGRSLDSAWSGRSLWLVAVMVLSLACPATMTDMAYPEIREYCERDLFAPKCLENEAIVLRHAKYGRMRDGRCIGTISGAMGCSADVKRLIDKQCSGRRECSVVVASLVPVDQQPCASDYRSYLEAAYDCVPVAYAQKELCTGPLEIKAPSGYLSSRVADENGCGTLDSPWFVTVSPGQHIRFTLLDFGEEVGTSITRKGQVCTVYAIIKEERLKASETICAAGVREAAVYTSASHMVEVRLVVRAGESTMNNHFMLHYEAVGCPDVAHPPHGWAKRDGDSLTVGCNGTGDLSHLRCDGSTWRGKWNNCTGAAGSPSLGAIQSQWSMFSQSHGVSIFVIVCIALGVGIIILTIGLVYLRRRSRGRRSQHSVRGDDCYQGKMHTNYTDQRIKTDTMCSQSENDYYKTWQLQRHTGTGTSHMPPPAPKHPHAAMPLPPPPYSDGSIGSGSTGYNRSRVEHIYESPKFLRKPCGEGGDGGEISSPTEYYELDPDMHGNNT